MPAQVDVYGNAYAELLAAISSGGIGFFFCLWGLANLDKQRRVFGSSLIGCGLLLAAIGLVTLIGR